MPSIPNDKRESFADLAMSIFLKHPPADPRALRETREKKAPGGGAMAGNSLDALLEDLGGGREQVSGCVHGPTLLNRRQACPLQGGALQFRECFPLLDHGPMTHLSCRVCRGCSAGVCGQRPHRARRQRGTLQGVQAPVHHTRAARRGCVPAVPCRAASIGRRRARERHVGEGRRYGADVRRVLGDKRALGRQSLAARHEGPGTGLFYGHA